MEFIISPLHPERIFYYINIFHCKRYFNNGIHWKMREKAKIDHEARFAIGTKHARMESDAAALFGAFKAMLTSGITKATRDGSEGFVTRNAQDFVLNTGADEIEDGLKKNKNKR